MKLPSLLVAASTLMLASAGLAPAAYEVGTIYAPSDPWGVYGPLEEAARQAGAGKPAELIRQAQDYYATNRLADNGRYTLSLKAAGLLVAGRTREAVETARKVEELHPRGLPSVCALWIYAVYLHAGEARDALRVLKRLHAGNPRETYWQDELAWLLSTHPSKDVRNAAEAIRFGEGAVRISSGRDPHPATALACALAEAGRYDEAITRQAEALSAARREGWSATELASMQRRLEEFRARSPHRQKLGREAVQQMLAGCFDVSARTKALRTGQAPGPTSSLPSR